MKTEKPRRETARLAGEQGGWGAVAASSWRQVKYNRVNLAAGAFAYRWFLAIFPLIIALLGVASLVSLPRHVVVSLIHGFGDALPSGAAQVFTTGDHAHERGHRRAERPPWCAVRARRAAAPRRRWPWQLDVDEHRHGAVLHDRRHGRREAGGHGDDLVAGQYASLAQAFARERHEGEQVGRRPRVHEQAVRQPEQGAELALEACGVAAVGEPEVEGGVDQVAELLGAEDATTVGHAGPARHEVVGRGAGGGGDALGRVPAAPERLVVVALDERQDLAAQLACLAHDPPSAPPAWAPTAGPPAHGRPSSRAART